MVCSRPFFCAQGAKVRRIVRILAKLAELSPGQALRCVELGKLQGVYQDSPQWDTPLPMSAPEIPQLDAPLSKGFGGVSLWGTAMVRRIGGALRRRRSEVHLPVAERFAGRFSGRVDGKVRQIGGKSPFPLDCRGCEGTKVRRIGETSCDFSRISPNWTHLSSQRADLSPNWTHLCPAETIISPIRRTIARRIRWRTHQTRGNRCMSAAMVKGEMIQKLAPAVAANR